MSDQVLESVFPQIPPSRLDLFLAGEYPQFSRSRVQQLIHAGRVSVDGEPVEKSSLILAPGQRVLVTVPPPAPVAIVPEKIELNILFENQDVLVIDKPAGMVVHPAYGHGTGTLVHAVLGREGDLPEIRGEIRPGIVHRLDKDTSGLIVIAKNDHSLQFLQEQFRGRAVVKKYLALVDGIPPTPSGRVEAPIGRDPKNRKRMAIVEPGKGREAVTEYRTLENFAAHTLLEVHPLTGRTHQIRVHLKFLRCPVSGDTVYGTKNSSLEIHRHFLHAASLKILLPGEVQPREFTSPLPVELQTALTALRRREK